MDFAMLTDLRNARMSDYEIFEKACFAPRWMGKSDRMIVPRRGVVISGAD
jgi:hypothetical protein